MSNAFLSKCEPRVQAVAVLTPAACSTRENAALNQYWYSPATVSTLVVEALQHASRAAFVSTPSVYFSLPPCALRDSSRVFDIDPQWASEPAFTAYDFRAPLAVPPELHQSFDYVLVDPPFITSEAIAAYASTVKLLLAPGGKVLISTVSENAPLLRELLGLTPLTFLPSCPHLVYQFTLFSNYDSEALGQPNPELQ